MADENWNEKTLAELEVSAAKLVELITGRPGGVDWREYGRTDGATVTVCVVGAAAGHDAVGDEDWALCTTDTDEHARKRLLYAVVREIVRDLEEHIGGRIERLRCRLGANGGAVPEVSVHASPPNGGE